MAFDLNAFIKSPTFMYTAIFCLVGYIIYKYIGNKPKTLIISRPEMVRRKMIAVLENNVVKNWVLKQTNNTIGIIKNIGYYYANEAKSEKIYLILYSPRFFWFIPAFWTQNVMVVSDKYIVEIKHEPKKPTSMILQSNYFLDQHFNLIMNLADENARKFINDRLLADEAELSSSVYTAQGISLTAVDLSKPFQNPAIEEKIKETGKV
jgi:hypothetical protein